MKNTLKKSITLILALAMLISVFGTFPMATSAASSKDDPTKYKQLSTEEGSLLVEIENIVVNTSEVAIESHKLASGRKHVRFLNTDTTQPEADAPAFAGFELTFDQPGKYVFFLRHISPSSDSLWMDWGALTYRTKLEGYQNVKTTPRSDSEDDFHWQRVGVLTVSEAGETVKVRMRTREGGRIWFDKLIVTNIGTYSPEGTGKKPDPESAYTPQSLPTDMYPIPTVTPPPEHPRVLFRAQDIPQIKANMEHPELAGVVKEYNALKDREYDGNLAEGDPNYDAKGLETLAAKALDYVLTGNEENGRNAIEGMINTLSQLDVASQGDNCRQEGHVVKVAGQVYDWCYPLLTDLEKGTIVTLTQGIAADMEIGFPPTLQGMLCGHGAEYQLYRDLFSIAIACYDEFPDMYNFIAGKILSPDSVEYRNWWNQSNTHSQGTSYGPQTRWKSEMQAHILFKKMCGYELFNEEDLVNIGYDFIYRRRPDGLQMIDGDDNRPNAVKEGAYDKGNLKEVMFLASAISGDPYLKREFFLEGGYSLDYSREAVQTVDKLLLANPNIDVNEGIRDTLPLTTYHASPVGEMIARTGWNLGAKSNDVIATMKIGEYNGMNHDNFDCGHFMIYYKGILANDSGWYEQHGSYQHRNYMAQSVAHNTLVIETPYNKWGNQNQGIDGPTKTNVDTSDGKNFYWIPASWEQYQTDKENHWAEVIGHEYGPDLQYPEYSYLAGDLARAYTSSYDDGVNEALRHMIFLPTGNEKNPAAFVVFDKIDTKVGGKKKAFLLHSEEEPVVSGNVTTITRTEDDYYNGKLVNQTLLPKSDNLKIDKIGGVEFDEKGEVVAGTDKRFWNRGQNFPFIQDNPDIVLTADTSGRIVREGNALEAGWGRVEIMPKKSDKVDYMLNVMYVGAADDKSPVEKATLIEADDFIGAKIFDRVAMFNTQKERTDKAVSFNVSGSGDLKVNVAGLKAGTWSVSANGENIGNQIASEDGGMIYFTAPAGSYTLTYVSGDADKTFTQSAAPEVEGVSIYFNNNYLYSDVAPTIRDGRTLIPMRALLEAIKAQVTWDEATATATAYSEDDDITIRITENSKTAYVNDKPVELDVPAQIIDGRFVIPVRFVSENLGAKVSWNETIQQVIIDKIMTEGQKALGIPNFIKIIGAEQSGAEANEARQINASYDGSHGSYWGVSSDGHDAWGIYEFNGVKTLDKVMLSFMSSHVRKYKFDIEVSEDGKNFTPVITGMETDGATKTGTFQAFDLKGAKAKYVRYRGYGNSVNMWNSMCEILFTEKK